MTEFTLADINLGDVDAKNEILKEARREKSTFFDSYTVPENIRISEIEEGTKYFIQGLKGTGKTALLRYFNELMLRKDNISKIVLFKSDVTEDDRQTLSSSSGYEIVSTGHEVLFHQDFKEAWKWYIFQTLGRSLKNEKKDCEYIDKFLKIVGANEKVFLSSFASLFSSLSAGKLNLSGDALGVAIECGISFEKNKGEDVGRLSDVNRVCIDLLKQIKLDRFAYILFDELELYHEKDEQFDRDRRIIRDLISSIATINSEMATSTQKIVIVAALRSEVIHSVMELGHEINRDIDDFGIRLQWFEGKEGPNHPLLRLIYRKMSLSTNTSEDQIASKFLPENIGMLSFHKYILRTSYYRPRDIVRLLNVARDHNPNSATFTQAHFDRTSNEYSKQTWIEITEELLASYSSNDVQAIEKLFLGSSTMFFKADLQSRIDTRHKYDKSVQSLFNRRTLERVLADLYRIGAIGNNFVSMTKDGGKVGRHRWVFRGSANMNDMERMMVHQSLWKHLSLIKGGNRQF